MCACRPILEEVNTAEKELLDLLRRMIADRDAHTNDLVRPHCSGIA